MRILVVDDENVSRQKMVKILLAHGECDAVDSGTTAVSVFSLALEEKKPFDLIALDIAMPDMDGTEVLTRIRTLEKEKRIPVKNRVKVLMVTALADQETIVKSIKSGCNDYIIKPFSPETVLKKLVKLGLSGKDSAGHT
ncbi:MAG: response regulator [Pseudomonadota bacterium]